MDLVRATQTAHVTDGNGVGLVVAGDTLWPADDPIVEGYPHLFDSDVRPALSVSRPWPQDEPEDEAVRDRPVEQATNAPGEKRPTRR